MDPVNRNASKEARELLDYLYSIQGKGIITGQHTQTKPCEEIEYIKDVTGKEPKLRGFELLSYSPNINYDSASKECLDEVYANKGTLDVAYKWAKETEGILTFTFHWFSPVGGEDKSFFTEHTDFDASKVLLEGTAERAAFYHDMDVIAEELKRFKDAGIPILWRPFHESEGVWFWWSAKGPEVAINLYKLMFDYYVNERQLNNLLWVWNSPLKEGYPGDEYVDVISRDLYPETDEPTDYSKEYEELVNNTTRNKVAALAEIGRLPDVKLLEKSRVPWAYYMIWSHGYCIGEQFNSKKKLREVYDSEYSITL